MANGGVPYYKVDTDRYENIRIKKLKNDCGPIGVAIYDYILCQIYGGNGYYIVCDDTLVFTVVDYLGIKSQNVIEVIGYACSKGLFDKELRACENILTSRSIQERWLLLAKRTKRSVPDIEKKYWLLSEDVVQQSYNSRTTKAKMSGKNSKRCTTVVQQMPNVVQQMPECPEKTQDVVQHEDVTGEYEKEKVPQTPKKNKEQEENSYNSACITFVGDSEPELFEEGEKPQPKQTETPAVKEETAAEKKVRLVALCEKKKHELYDALVPYVSVYGKEMIRDFYDYWVEPNKSGTQVRWQMEKTWSLERRLRTWAGKSKSYGTSRTSKSEQPAVGSFDKSRDSYAGISELVRKRII